MIRLAALDGCLAIVCTLRELVWPVHPADAGINVMLVACPNLQNPRHPVIVQLLPRPDRFVIGHSLLALDAGIIRDVDETLAVVLNTVDCS